MRSTHLAVAAFVSLLLACSGDDGKPSGNTSSGGTPDAGSSEGGTAAKKKNAEGPCAANEECESNLCFIGGNQSYCSLPCTVANGPMICTAPFTGSCNNRGACKRD